MKTYKRVALLGVDGAGRFFRDTDTPHLDRIFADGAVSYDVLTSNPTISAECWGSMLHGVTPDLHRLTNSIVSANPYDVQSIFPSVFRVIRENLPEAELASFCNWNPINTGIIEENLHMTKGTGGDAAVTEQVCAYVAEHDPVFLFVQFDEVDGAGHRYGYGEPKHLEQITISDGYIEQIYEAYAKRGFLEDTLFLVTADHGGHDHGHGGLTDEEKYVMFAAAGRTVEKGEIRDMLIRDSASIVLYALGLEQPETWTSRVPGGLFAGVEAGERPEYVIPYAEDHREHVSVPTPVFGGGNDLSAVLGKERMLAYFPLDTDTKDAAGNVETEASGKLYYVEGYHGRGMRFDDGYIALHTDAIGKKSFSVAFWMKTGGVQQDPAVFSNKAWDNGRNPGYILALTAGALHFNAGNGEERMDVEQALPLDYKDGWVYVTLAVDREGGELWFSYDFNPLQRAVIPEALRNSAWDGYPCLHIGQDGTGTYGIGLSAVLDEIVFVDGVLTEEDVAALRRYYKPEE